MPKRLLNMASHWLTRTWFALLPALVTFVLAVWLNADFGRRPLGGDESDYHRIAVSLATTGRFGTAYRFPAYPLVVAGFYKVFGMNPAVMRIPQALLAGLTVFLTCLLARRAGLGELGAATSGVLLMADGYVFLFSGLLLTESLFTPMVLVSTLVMARKADTERTGYRTRTLAAGAVLGLLALTRGQGVFFLATCLTLGIWGHRQVRHRAGLPPWGYSALATAAAGLVLWNIVIHRELGRFPGFTTGTGGVLYGSHCPEAYRDARAAGRWTNPDTASGSSKQASISDEWTRNRSLLRMARQSALSHSLEQNVRLLANKLFSALYPSAGVSPSARLWLKVPAILVAWGIMIGFVLGLCRCPRSVSRQHVPFYLGTLATVLLFYGSKRLLYPVFPLICIDSVRAWKRTLGHGFRSSDKRGAEA